MITNVIKILKTANLQTTNKRFPQIEKFVSYNYECPQKVIIAALAMKIYDESCDTRYHQKSHGAKYCLRSVETQTTLWASKEGYFSSSCPGTLSNGLRHKDPYNKDYSRAWRSKECKSLFLEIFELMNTKPDICMDMLVYNLQLYKDLKEKHNLLANTTIEPIIDLYTLLCNLCTQTYNKSSVIPVYIVHTYYKVIETTGLISLKAHNSPDIQGKSYGDIEIHQDNKPIIVIEIKHNLEIKEQHLHTMYRKTQTLRSNNYVLTSLVYQRYQYNNSYNCVSWNVASFVHYNLYNTSYQKRYIEELYKTFMMSNLDVQIKKKIQNCFQL
jgi:hypothetical protein